MAIEMDIDMDLDVDHVEDYGPLDLAVPLGNAITRTDYNEDPLAVSLSETDLMQLAPSKIHLRGLDNLTSSDLQAFVAKYFEPKHLERIEWIDDTSANLVYATSSIAMEALAALTDATPSNMRQITPLQMLPTKPFPGHPEIRLEARLAVLRDRKEAGARDRSRFYLFNPEYDPGERRKREGYDRRGGRRYRDRDDSRHNRPEDTEAFDESLYDDDEVTRAVRASKTQSGRDSRQSVSSGEYRGQGIRKARPNGGVGRELFPDRLLGVHRHGGRFRNRSASPLLGEEDANQRPRSISASSSANRLQAQIIKSRIRGAIVEPKELFPQKAAINHRRSDAFDAADATADLFATRMSVSSLKSDGDSVATRQDFTSRVAMAKLGDHVSLSDGSDHKGFNIRGMAKQQPSSGISIKGISLASGNSVKELFPFKTPLNSDKELFSEKLDGRGGIRRRAEDMFR